MIFSSLFCFRLKERDSFSRWRCGKLIFAEQYCCAIFCICLTIDVENRFSVIVSQIQQSTIVLLLLGLLKPAATGRITSGRVFLGKMSLSLNSLSIKESRERRPQGANPSNMKSNQTIGCCVFTFRTLNQNLTRQMHILHQVIDNKLLFQY